MVDPLSISVAADIIDGVTAAEIQARANRIAAWIQGGLTLATGLLAFFAGILAYKAATRETARLEGDATARAQSYRYLLLAIVAKVHEATAATLPIANKYCNHHLTSGGSKTLRASAIGCPKELDAENWHNHSILGPEIANAIIALRDAASEYNLFAFKAIDLKFMTDSPTGSFVCLYTEDGEIDKIEEELGFELYLRLAQALHDQTTKLLILLKPTFFDH